MRQQRNVRTRTTPETNRDGDNASPRCGHVPVRRLSTRGPVAGRSPGLPVLTACLPARNRAVASRGGPHRLTVAGAAAAYERDSRSPHSRFIGDDEFAADTCYREFYRFPAPKISPLARSCQRCERSPTNCHRSAVRKASRASGAAIICALTDIARVARKLYIRTFGCQMHEYDSARIADVLAAEDGLARTDRPDDAHIIVCNTCSVRANSQDRVSNDSVRLRTSKAQDS